MSHHYVNSGISISSSLSLPLRLTFSSSWGLAYFANLLDINYCLKVANTNEFPFALEFKSHVNYNKIQNAEQEQQQQPQQKYFISFWLYQKFA